MNLTDALIQQTSTFPLKLLHTQHILYQSRVSPTPAMLIKKGQKRQAMLVEVTQSKPSIEQSTQRSTMRRTTRRTKTRRKEMSKRRWSIAVRMTGIATKIRMTAVMTMRNVKVMLIAVKVCPAYLLLNLPLSVSPIRAIKKVYKNDGVGGTWMRMPRYLAFWPI